MSWSSSGCRVIIIFRLHRNWYFRPYRCCDRPPVQQHAEEVQKALDEQGIDYEVVRHPTFPRSRRKAYMKLTGQKLFPAIELEDGRIVREESKDLAAHIREGRLLGGAGPQG